MAPLVGGLPIPLQVRCMRVLSPAHDSATLLLRFDSELRNVLISGRCESFAGCWKFGDLQPAVAPSRGRKTTLCAMCSGEFATVLPVVLHIRIFASNACDAAGIVTFRLKDARRTSASRNFTNLRVARRSNAVVFRIRKWCGMQRFPAGTIPGLVRYRSSRDGRVDGGLVRESCAV